MRKGDSDNATKTRRYRKEKIRKQLIDTLIYNKKIETEDLNEKASNEEKSEDYVIIVRDYEEIIRTKKKNIVCNANHQGKIFQRFKVKEKFIKLVKTFKVHNTTTIFKINILTIFKMEGGGAKRPPTSFSAIPSANPKLLSLNQEHPPKELGFFGQIFIRH